MVHAHRRGWHARSTRKNKGESEMRLIAKKEEGPGVVFRVDYIVESGEILLSGDQEMLSTVKRSGKRFIVFHNPFNLMTISSVDQPPFNYPIPQHLSIIGLVFPFINNSVTYYLDNYTGHQYSITIEACSISFLSPPQVYIPFTL